MSDPIVLNIDISNAAATALSNFSKNAQNADKSFKKLEITGKSTFNEIALSIGKSISAYDIFKGNLAANLVTKGFDFIRDSASRFFDATIEGAAESEQAIKNLNIALEQAGLYTGETSKRFQDFANGLQQTTVYGDEAVLSSVALLASLTNLNEEGLKKATIASANLATTLGIDLASATEMIQKAVNGNVTAFAKKGITIQKADTDAARLVNTLAALATQEGAAAKAAETYTGAREKGNNQQGEFLEGLGKLITQSSTVIAALKAKAIAFESLAKFVSDNAESIRNFGTAVLITAGILATGAAAAYVTSSALTVLALASATGTTAFGLLSIAASSAWAAITAPISLIVIGIGALVAITYQVVKNFDSIKAAAYNALAATLEFAAKGVSAIGGNASELQNEAKAWRDKAQAIKETSVAATDAAKKEEQEKQDAAAKLKAKHAIELEEISIRNTSEQEQQRIQIATLAEIETESQDTLAAIRDGYRADDLLKKQEHERVMLQLAIDADVAKALLEKDSAKRTADLQNISNKAAVDQAKLRAKQEAEIAKDKVDNQRQVYGTIATLATSGNKTLAAVGKAAGLTQIAIDTPPAVARAYKEGGPYLGPVLAAATYAAMGAQAAKLAGISFASGGIVPGTSFTGDKVAANVNSSEMILNKSQQSQLFELANGRGNTQGGVSREEVASMISAVANRPIVIQMNGKEIVNVLREETQSGRRFT